jgi:sialate O-acetylesterase
VTNLTLSNVFSDDMILQRDGKGSSIFGIAPAGATIVVTIDGGAPITASAGLDPWNATAGTIPNGWAVHLAPHAASLADAMHTVRIECTKGCPASGINLLTLSRVKFGDVIICAGQSNMELILGVTFSWYGEYEATDQWSRGLNISNDTAYPIHFAHLDHNLQLDPSDSPTLPWIVPVNPSRGEGRPTWSVSSEAGWQGLRGFSGTCWYTGRALYNLRTGTANEGVPIGLVEAAWGGTIIESWIPIEDQFACTGRLCEDYFDRSSNTVGQSCDRTDQSPDSQPASLWNGMVNPLKQMAIFSALWYQVLPRLL